MSAESISTNSINMVLPVEMIDHIFNFVPLSQLGNLASVCKRWHGIAMVERRWKRICLTLGMGEKSQNQTWYAFASSQVNLCLFFEQGGLLESTPIVSNQLLTVEENRESQDRIRTMPVPESCENEKFEISVIKDPIWRSALPTATTIRIHFKDNSEEDYIFTIFVEFAGLALQENILAIVDTCSGEIILSLLDIKEMIKEKKTKKLSDNLNVVSLVQKASWLYQFRSPSERESIQQPESKQIKKEEPVVRLTWIGNALYFYSNENSDKGDMTVKKWDFSLCTPRTPQKSSENSQDQVDGSQNQRRNKQGQRRGGRGPAIPPSGRYPNLPPIGPAIPPSGRGTNLPPGGRGTNLPSTNCLLC